MTRKRYNVPATEQLILDCIRRKPIGRQTLIEQLEMKTSTFDWYLRRLRKRYNIVSTFTGEGWVYEILDPKNVILPD